MLEHIKSFAIGALLAALIVLLLLGRGTSQPKNAGAEVNAPAVTQSDGSQIARKTVVSTPPVVPHVLPKGSRVLREEAITLTPTGLPPDKAVHVDATLVETPDKQTHLITSSPDGTTNATDTVVSLPVEDPPKNSLLLGWGGPDNYLLGYTRHLFWKLDAGAIVTVSPIENRIYAVGVIHW